MIAGCGVPKGLICTFFALLGALILGSVGVVLCITYEFLDKTENKVLDVTIHPFNQTNHDRSQSLGEKPEIEEVMPIDLTITVEKENLTYHENGYISFTLKKSIVEESQSVKQIHPDMKHTLEILTQHVNILMKEGRIVEVNNSDKFGPYTGNCNMVKGSVGFSFPIPLTSKEKVYDPIAKQAVPLVRISSMADRTYYEPIESYLATEEYYPENACYAHKQAEVEDPKDGILYIGNDIIISQPHFLDGDPRLVDNVDGLLPDKKKHGIQYTVDTKTGETLKSRFTVQFNSQHNNTLLPMFWIEVNYTKAKPPYDEVFYVGVAFIGFGVLGGALVRIHLFVKKVISIRAYFTPPLISNIDVRTKEILKPILISACFRSSLASASRNTLTRRCLDIHTWGRNSLRSLRRESRP